jgi:transposase
MYSLHIRRKILRIKEKEKLSFTKIAKRFGMSPNTIYKWTKRIEPKITRERKSKKVDMARLEADVEKNPDSYQYERAKKFKVSQSTVWRELKRIGATYKKSFQTSKGRRDKAYYV